MYQLAARCSRLAEPDFEAWRGQEEEEREGRGEFKRMRTVWFVGNLESRDFDPSSTRAACSAFSFDGERPETAVRPFKIASPEIARLQPAKRALIMQRRAREPAKYKQAIRKRSEVKHSGANDRWKGSVAREGGGGRKGKVGGVRAHGGTFVRSTFCATKRLISHFPSSYGPRRIFYTFQFPKGGFWSIARSEIATESALTRVVR